MREGKAEVEVKREDHIKDIEEITKEEDIHLHVNQREGIKNRKEGPHPLVFLHLNRQILMKLIKKMFLTKNEKVKALIKFKTTNCLFKSIYSF